MARTHELRVKNRYGDGMLKIKVEALYSTNSTVIETQWTDASGDASFTALPDTGSVDFKIYKAPFYIEHIRKAIIGETSGTLDHGALSGLGDDDHTQYVLESLYDAKTILIASTDNTPVAAPISGTTLPETGIDGQTFIDTDLPGFYVWNT